MIVLDRTDMQFVSDIKDLQAQFDVIKDASVMAVGLDLSPHYLKQLKGYLEANPQSTLGAPGAQQGLNTGVVLFDLEKMRKNRIYNGYLNAKSVHVLFKKYRMDLTLGDQDWFTLLSFEQPQLVSLLPCRFNVQLSLEYWAGNRENFTRYHYCDAPASLKIVHFNGCGPKPLHCGSGPVEVKDFREHLHLFHQILTMDNFWIFVGMVFEEYT